MFHFNLLRFTVVLTLVLSASRSWAGEIVFSRDIRPILSDKCFFCHGPDPDQREAELRLDLQEQAHASAIVPGSLEDSALIARITSADPDTQMPPAESGKKLNSQEIDLLKAWVQQGAKYQSHWAFSSPTQLETATESDWVRNPIDAFVYERLNQQQLSPQAEADRRTLIRRVTFDLTGLPPTLEEVSNFLNDNSPTAYENVVDRLLKSPHYGERMAVMWMDAARYGDTSVFHADGPRDMWAWRDWVVQAYNKNLSFDKFSIYQLAGDLLPDATLEQKLASGFNRNNGTTDEGGAIAEEYRVEYAVDRVKTTSNIWMGLTMECSQCHDHKYDPITLTDYYSMYAFFNISADNGMQTRNGNEAPLLEIPNTENLKKLPQVREQLASTTEQIEARKTEIEPAFQTWLTEATTKALAEATTGRHLDVDPVHRFAFEEESENQISCTFTEDLKGTFNGKVERTEGHRGRGLKLAGGYVEVGDIGNFERDTQFSVSTWVKPAKSSSGAIIARMDSPNGHRGYDLFLQGGSIAMHIINTWPTNAVKVTTKKQLEFDKWQHVVATYDGTSKAAGVKIYINGENWDWNIEQDHLSETIRTEKTFLIGTRHGGALMQGEVDEISLFDRMLSPEEAKTLAEDNPLPSLLAIAPEHRTESQLQQLRQHYLTKLDAPYQQLLEQRDAFTKQIAELQKPLTTVMMMADMGTPRETFILKRGAYDSPSDTKVEPNTPAFLPAMFEGAPRNRLGLAQWLFQPNNPLTARVAVNRYWQMLFGNGLVTTLADFGSQGDFPTHPELLDWLAVDFEQSGWDVQRMLKQIVMSATYRQSSHTSVDSYQSDSANRHLARGARFRLQGEFVRDNALFLSGLLVDRLGGPGVKPYQPPGLWEEVGLSGEPKFTQDTGEALYRRSLYTYWKRSAPPPSMQIFDAPTREKCTIQRPRTNTPLQALVTLNDVQFVEASRHFAERILKLEGDDTSRLSSAFQQTTARLPDAHEQTVLLNILKHARENYASDLEAAQALLSQGESARDAALEPIEHAAWTVVTSSLLNLDETLNRE